MEEEREKDILEVMGEEREELEGDEGIERIEGDESDEAGLDEEGMDLKPQIDFKKAIGVASILVFGIVILILGGLRLRGMIEGSFVGYGEDNPNLQMNANAPNATNDEVVAMQARDTDGDGLNDYDETYVYKTSAYIEDTDSDGLTDGDEVAKGSDPLCPVGVDCYKETNLTNVTNETNGIDLDRVREMLIEQGVDSEVVMAVDDETLLLMYRETVAETGVDPLMDTNGETNGDELPMGTNSANDGLTNLTAEEIRQYLIGAGVDESVIMSIDDETLMALYLQALGEMGE